MRNGEKENGRLIEPAVPIFNSQFNRLLLRLRSDPAAGARIVVAGRNSKVRIRNLNVAVARILERTDRLVRAASVRLRVVRQAAVVSFPSRHWFRSPIRAARYRFRKCPVYFYEREQIEALGVDAGFGNIEIYKIPGAGMDYHVCLRP